MKTSHHTRGFLSVAAAFALLIPVAAIEASTVTFDNQSGRPALVKLIGPTASSVTVENAKKEPVSVAPGHYFIRVRYGTPGAYSYSKGDEFDVTETATTASAITITLHKVVAGNYGSKAIDETEFEAPTTNATLAGNAPAIEEVPKFGGYFFTGLYDKHASAVGFAFDPSHKEFARSSRAGFSSQKLLEELAKDAADIRELSDSFTNRFVAAQVFGQFQGREIGDSLFVMLFPKREIKSQNTKKVETLRTFQPGSVSTLKMIEAEFGPPTEKERFEGPLWVSLGFDGMVCWWEDVGVAVASGGAVTHVLVRSAPQPAKK